MADKMEKPTASTFSAGLNTTQGLSPLQWSDKCFLCGKEIGESDPRGFYQGTNSMALCHRGCLNIMETNGGTPADYHRATDTPAPAAATGATAAQESIPGANGPAEPKQWIVFPNLDALQAYIQSKGNISPNTRVSVAGQVIQE